MNDPNLLFCRSAAQSKKDVILIASLVVMRDVKLRRWSDLLTLPIGPCADGRPDTVCCIYKLEDW
jgi:hypothetical protein